MGNQIYKIKKYKSNQVTLGLPRWHGGKESTFQCGRCKIQTWIQSPGQEDSLEKEISIHTSILTWKCHGQRSIAGYNPWGGKEFDMTEHACKKQTSNANHTSLTIFYSQLNIYYILSRNVEILMSCNWITPVQKGLLGERITNAGRLC